VKKIKETKGCTYFQVSNTSGGVYVCAVLGMKVSVLKYAPHPLNRFMVVKELPIETMKPKSIHVMETKDDGVVKIKVCTDDANGFKIYDLALSTIEIVSPLNIQATQLGGPVGGVLFHEAGKELFCMCYKNMGLLQHLDQQFLKTMFTWRYPLEFVTKMSMSRDYLVAGSQNVVDVIDISTGKIIHVFETKKDKNRELRLLLSNQDGTFD
jgi:hypothetical protein